MINISEANNITSKNLMVYLGIIFIIRATTSKLDFKLIEINLLVVYPSPNEAKIDIFRIVDR